MQPFLIPSIHPDPPNLVFNSHRLLFTQLNNIGRLLTDQGVRQCYQQNSFSFTDAINTARNQVKQCVDDKINEVRTIVENGISNIANAISDTNNVAQLLANCNQLTLSYPSVAGLIAKGACLNSVIAL